MTHRSTPLQPTLAEIEAAARRLRPHLRPTPLYAPEGKDELIFKLEFLQRSGSFKFRGALHKLLCLGEAAARGVVAASGGNHGLAVAQAAALLGRPAQIFVPHTAPAIKREAIEAAGAQLFTVEGDLQAADGEARARAQAQHLPYVPPFDDAEVIAGQGTLMLEILRARPDVRAVAVAVGGGGLLAGMLRAAPPGVQLVGLEPEGIATVSEALPQATPVTLARIDSIAADALGARRTSQRVLDLLRPAWLAGTLQMRCVPDDAIIEARRWLWRAHRIVVEHGAALGVAALRSGQLDAYPRPLCIVLCGANTDPSDLV